MLADKESCTGCGACVNSCPNGAIKMKRDCEGFAYPFVADKFCMDCKICTKVCPVINKSENIQEKAPFFYIAKARHSEVNSTSGGIFAILARYVLERKGIVFGAAYNEKFQVMHTYISKEQDLYKLQGSKYVQSNIGHVFRIVKKILCEDKIVLFSGTTCQIEGLKSFLGKEYNNLICLDIVCHGVPSPGVWEKYLKCFHKKKIDKINFRNEKDVSRKMFCIKYDDGKEYNKLYPQDPYISGFCYDLFLRKSCYKCKFKGINRNSDMTLGDAWGVEKYWHVLKLEGNKDKLSIIMINSENGKKIWNEVEDKVIFCQVNQNEVIRNNMMLVKSVDDNHNRNIFFSDIRRYCFKAVLKKYYYKQIMKK